MAVRASAMLNTVAEELQIPEEELLREGLRAFLERQLRSFLKLSDEPGRY
jgi:hypothetical protein